MQQCNNFVNKTCEIGKFEYSSSTNKLDKKQFLNIKMCREVILPGRCIARTMEPIPELELSWSAGMAAGGVWFGAPLVPRPCGL